MLALQLAATAQKKKVLPLAPTPKVAIAAPHVAEPQMPPTTLPSVSASVLMRAPLPTR
jgi:hypothetical protein